MYIRALKVVKKEKHPQAENLWVYNFWATGTDPIQVVANTETIYEVGDIAAVALIGAELKDGTRITKVRLRGMASFGMALGHVEAEVGTDLTSEFGVPSDGKPRHISWMSIELLHYIVRGLKKSRGDMALPDVTYRSKIKLDGTNAGVQILTDGTVLAQSRTKLLVEGDDNYGFARWVKSHKSYFSSFASAKSIVLYGEWCGSGIQKRTAVACVDRKIFVVFGMTRGYGLVSEPDEIREMLPPHDDIFVLPWYGDPITLKYGNQAALEGAVQAINQVVADVEAEDPWVKDTFDISGIGEGVVFYPVSGVPWYVSPSEMMFKAKGEKHQVVKQKKAAQIDPEVAQSIEGFVALFVTANRLEQILEQACEGDSHPNKTGVFLKAFNADVIKESVVELEASGLTWKQASRAVATAARVWFLARPI